MYTISFNFDDKTKSISNVKIIDITPTSIDDTVIQIVDNKLVLSKAAIETLGAVAGDRIAINYWQEKDDIIPLIGKSENFTDSNGGNRLTKSNTVSFRGVQRELLLEHGSMFTLEEFKENIFKLNPVKENTDDKDDELQDEKSDLKDLERIVIEA